jgi:LEA14-like dessication related protein
MRSRILLATAVALSLGLLAGCAELSKFASAALQRPHLTFQSASLQALDLSGATVAFQYQIENPNEFGLDLARIAYQLDLEGHRIVDGDLPGGVKIPARGSAPVSFPVRVRFADVPGFASLLSQRDAVAYRLSGAVGVRTPVGVVEVPLSHEDRIPVPKLPGFALDGISVRSASLTDVVLDVKLRVDNPNRFPLPAAKLAYGLTVGGAPVASAEAKDLRPVAGADTSLVAIPVRVSVAGASRAVAQLVQGSAVDVALTGSADFGGVPVPVDVRARLRAGR